MGRRIQTDVPQSEETLIPSWPFMEEFRKRDQEYKKKQKQYYDKRNRVRTLPALPDESPVWVSTQQKQVPGTVLEPADTPRSYILDTPTGQVRRNRCDIRMRPTSSEHKNEGKTTDHEVEMDHEMEADSDQGTDPAADERMMTRSRSGTVVRPPDRLTY